jgi:hypothetical protein
MGEGEAEGELMKESRNSEKLPRKYRSVGVEELMEWRGCGRLFLRLEDAYQSVSFIELDQLPSNFL